MGKEIETLKPLRLLHMRMPLPLLPPLKVPPRAPPHARDLRRQRTHHDARAGRRAGENIPRPLLRRPQRVDAHRVRAAVPRQERRRPRDPRVELVVQRARAQHADRDAAQHRRQHEARRDAPRDGDLVVRLGEDHADRVEQRGPLRGGEPARDGEGGEEGGVQAEQAEREGLGEEGGLRHEAPVDGPFVEEDAGELEGAGEVGAGVGLKEGEAEEELGMSMLLFLFGVGGRGIVT